MKKYDKILLLSGLDSYIAWHYEGQPQTLYCRLGHRYQEEEEKWIEELVPDTIFTGAIQLGAWEESDAFIPMRNLFLVSVAALYSNNIILTVQKGELSLTDRSPVFMEAISGMLSYLNEYKYKVSSPFVNMTKTQMVRWYLDKGLCSADLVETVSCYSGHATPCGKCNACFRRAIAFANCGIEETYESNILDYVGIPVYVRAMKAGEYDEQRTKETMEGLKILGYVELS